MSFVAEASKAIRDSGGRMTSQRELILELLEHAGENMDAEGLYQRAQVNDPTISLATVYRTLNVLESAGLVQQRYISREHDRRYYEPVHAEEEYHFTCRNCRKVIAFKSDQVAALKHYLETELGVQVIHACVCVDGLCAECRERPDVDLKSIETRN